MRGIYDSSSTGQRSMLSQATHPFGKGTGVIGIKKGDDSDASGAGVKAAASQPGANEASCDKWEGAPSGSAGSPSKAAERAKAARMEFLMRGFLPKQVGSSRQATSAPKPTQSPSQA